MAIKAPKPAAEPTATTVTVVGSGIALSAAFNWALCHVEPLKSAVNLQAIHDEIKQQGESPLGFNIITFSAVSVLLYYIMVQWHNQMRTKESLQGSRDWADAEGSLIGKALIWWNLALTALSMLMFTGLLVPMIDVIVVQRTTDLYKMMCDGTQTWGIAGPGSDPQGTAILMPIYMYMFMLSKFPELIDTLFLVVRGRAIPFLHWYHHISVLLYVVIAMYSQYPGVFFSLINSFVHSVMYYYYGRRAMGTTLKIAKYITIIQLSQMVVGILLTVIFVAAHYMNNTCDGGIFPDSGSSDGYGTLYSIFACTAVMYGSYFYLFYGFYTKRYNTPATKVTGQGTPLKI